ncbi:high affinity potassium transport protein [Aaosphaeria arxii CBS 175.79]|uniref:Potassium transport protein n=1 Tax=Aaosphaeria arxii CBS 175.79 TaxID=1450172 RepID=A0A6A5Y768_9PLEO|nr:high affinity potassium transport protein [Aaosphaeria arxii CBS 175.79]KAF2021126.1 high affinity potassium transport protein [Aaosphaeria arxii CBS 175.79]
MFGPWIVAFGWLKKHTPRKISPFRLQMNFITLHYVYIIFMTLLGSIMIYPAGDLAYIDALFFASGSATQSGLNTVDLNRIKLYQQIVIYFITIMCTPIFINTFVVFIRLYWFEKRFQHVVSEARSLRRYKSRSRTKSQAKQDLEIDPAREEEGVGDREIRVLRAPDGAATGTKIEDEDRFRDGEIEDDPHLPIRAPTTDEKRNNQDDYDFPRTDRVNMPFHRDISFADEVVSPTPSQRRETAIAFVENQRNPKDKGVYRVPGPRDYDLGFTPQRIEEDEQLNKETTNEDGQSPIRRHRSNSVPPTELNSDDHPLKQHITIDVPDTRPRPHGGPSAYTLNTGRAVTADAETPTAGQHLRQRTTRTFSSFLSKAREEERDPMPYLSWSATVGRNSAFVDLTEDQREELGGIEYRALKLLAVILVCYYIGFHLLGMVVLTPWINRDGHYRGVVEEVGVDPTWWGFFTPASMFNDLGFTLTPTSMIPFQFAVLPLLLGTFLIIIGNTGFPCMLRFIIWLSSKCVPYGSGVWEELRFLLDHPRRCFTLLFPSSANWWLFWVLILLNGIDLIFFVILDLKDPTVTSLPAGFKFLDGLFQAAATRTAGFAVVNIADLHPAIQVSYLIMMYISIFPIAISMRQTNVYEEKSLGVYSSEEDEETKSSYLGTHLRRQLSFDLWFVFLGFFLIAIVEGSRLENTNEYAFTLFTVLFEIVSAYGTVGLSLGYPGINASFSAEFRTLSKLIIIAMQIRGRHRSLPYALDRAILLPSESLHKKEDEDATRRARRPSNASFNGLHQTNSGLTRRPSTVTLEGANTRGRFRPQDVGRFLSGALNAGPSMPREKRA